MKKLFCIADIHSFYDEMMLALDNAGFDIDNNDHILVHCGDLLDRGPKALDCLNFVNSLPANRKILIRGNHEDLLEDVFARGYLYYIDDHNGTVDTCVQLSGITKVDMLSHELTMFAALDKVKNRPELKEYLNSLVDYKEIGNYIFVHGWIPAFYKNGKPVWNLEEYWKDGNWNNARWSNGMDMWSQGYMFKDKTIVCGHFHTSWGHSRLHKEGSEFEEDACFDTFIDNGIICLDGCVAYSKQVNCYVIEIEDDIWRGSM